MSDVLAAVALLVSLGTVIYSEWRYRTSFRLAWYKEVVDWAKCCVRNLSEIHEICDLPRGLNDGESQRKLLAELSSLIDEGRFVFENDRSDDFGDGKPRAYRGYRPDVLDYLIEAYRLLKNLEVRQGPAAHATCDKIIELKRLFVSDVQEAIEPNWFAHQAKITRESPK